MPAIAAACWKNGDPGGRMGGTSCVFSDISAVVPLMWLMCTAIAVVICGISCSVTLFYPF